MSTDERFTDEQMAEALAERAKLPRGRRREPQTEVQRRRAVAIDAELARQRAARAAETRKKNAAKRAAAQKKGSRRA